MNSTVKRRLLFAFLGLLLLTGFLFGQVVQLRSLTGRSQDRFARKLEPSRSAAATIAQPQSTLSSKAVSENVSLPLPAQSGGSYNLTQSVIPGGGGTSASGTTSVTGSVGQAATTVSSGGSYSISGGFWASQGGGGGCTPITVAPPGPALPTGTAGAPYSQTFTQTGGVGAVTFSLSAGAFPNGLTLTTGGVLSGTSTVFGNFSFTIRATDANTCFGERAYTLTLNPPCPGITLNPTTLPNGFIGTAYSQTLTATGGTAPHSFAVTAGSLPNGLTLGGNVALTGTPTLAGGFNFTVTVMDASGCTGVRSYQVTIFSGLQFYPLTAPVRLLDTRDGASPNACFQPNAAIAGQTARVQAGRSTCGIPAAAQALTGNVTTVPSGNGFLTLYPSDVTLPPVAATNFALGTVINNVFTVKLAASGPNEGSFNIFASSSTEVIVDVTGYYAPPGASGLYFHPLSAPIRLLDTRSNQLAYTTPGALLMGNTDTAQVGRNLTYNGVTIPAAAQALVGNATTVGPTAGGFLTLYPQGQARPLVASSNYSAGSVRNGPFTVGLGASGELMMYVSSSTHLVVDVLGYYSAEASDVNGEGLLFSPLPAPVRLLDTRASATTGCDRPGAALQTATTRVQAARDFCTIPATAQGIVGNATTVNSGAGFITFYPGSVASRPLAATSNFVAGQVFNRHFMVGLGNAEGAFKIYTSATTDLVIDVSGYFAP